MSSCGAMEGIRVGSGRRVLLCGAFVVHNSFPWPCFRLGGGGVLTLQSCAINAINSN